MKVEFGPKNMEPVCIGSELSHDDSWATLKLYGDGKDATKDVLVLSGTAKELRRLLRVWSGGLRRERAK